MGGGGLYCRKRECGKKGGQGADCETGKGERVKKQVGVFAMLVSREREKLRLEDRPVEGELELRERGARGKGKNHLMGKVIRK